LAAGLVAALAGAPGHGARPVSSCANGRVALTFDDGPSPTTPQLLAALKASNLRATMFDIGRNAAARPDLVRAQVAAGMWIGDHTQTHPHLPRLPGRRVAAEIAGARDVLRRITGRAPTLWRPPYLATSARVRAIARRLGLREVLVTLDSRDYAGASSDQIVAALGRAKDGDVVLLHDWPPATLAAVPRIAEVLARHRLCTGPVPIAGRALSKL
jgi:peptidoglycan/xylan/chitin deacetylase (PgdA/CDA1 family)